METDLDDEGEVARLQARLKKEGVDRKLAALGARPGRRRPDPAGRVFEFVTPTTDRAGTDREPADA